MTMKPTNLSLLLLLLLFGSCSNTENANTSATAAPEASEEPIEASIFSPEITNFFKQLDDVDPQANGISLVTRMAEENGVEVGKVHWKEDALFLETKAPGDGKIKTIVGNYNFISKRMIAMTFQLYSEGLVKNTDFAEFRKTFLLYVTSDKKLWRLGNTIEGRFHSAYDIDQKGPAEIIILNDTSFSAGRSGRYDVYAIDGPNWSKLGEFAEFTESQSAGGDKQVAISDQGVKITTSTSTRKDDGSLETKDDIESYTFEQFLSLVKLNAGLKVDESTLSDVVDYYNFLRAYDTELFYPELPESDGFWQGANYIIDKKNGYIESVLDEMDRSVLQVCLFRDAEGKGILVVNRFAHITHWDTWQIPKGEKLQFFGVRNGRFQALTFDTFEGLSPTNFASEDGKYAVYPDPYFKLPRYGTQIQYIIYPPILHHLKEFDSDWPPVADGEPPPADWIGNIEAKISTAVYLNKDSVAIGFDKASREFFVVAD